MSDEEALRLAIRTTPEDTTARLVYADWLDENGRPEGELVRPLVLTRVFWRPHPVPDWFYRYRDWPPVRHGDFQQWLFDVLRPELWADPQQYRRCLGAMARRWLPVVHRHLPCDHWARSLLERVGAGVEGEDPYLGGHVLSAVTSLADQFRWGYGDVAGDSAHEECLEVVHVIGWSWLGLPPLRPVVPAEDTRRRSWLAYNPHRDRSSAAKRPWWQRVFGD